MANTRLVVLMLLLLVAISLVPIAMAEENTTTTNTTGNETVDTNTTDTGTNSTAETNSTLTNETEDEVGAVVYPYGAEVRLLQLEKALAQNILKGEEVIKYLLEQNSAADVTELNSILDKMSILLEEIKAAPTEGTGEELAQIYVDLKSDAISLTKQFREEVKDLLSASARNRLTERFKNMNHTYINRLENAIEEAKHLYNSEQVKALFTSLNITDEDLISAVENGTATTEDIKDAVESALEGMTKEQREEAMLRLREATSKKAVAYRAAFSKALSNMFQRQSERWEDRSQKFLNKSHEAEANNQTLKSRVMEKISERAEERSDDFEEKGEQVREKFQEKLEERMSGRESGEDNPSDGSGSGIPGIHSGGRGGDADDDEGADAEDDDKEEDGDGPTGYASGSGGGEDQGGSGNSGYRAKWGDQ
jgi:hypothetical protein